MWQIIRIIVAVFVSVETAFAGMFAGIATKKIEVPQPETGEYSQYVDPFIGTGGTPWTCGMVSPAACAPFGAVRLGADTTFLGGTYITKMNTSGYYYEQGHILGFSHSRLSGTGAEDYNIFRITPAVGNKKAGVIPYLHSNETASPGYYAVALPAVGCLAEMTADQHTGVHRYTFYHSKDARLSLDVTSTVGSGHATKGFANYDEETGIITGGAEIHAAFSDRYSGLPCYFALEVNQEIKECKISGSEDDMKVDINFGNLNNKSVEVKVGISFVSVENAILNLQEETNGLDFDGVRQKTLNDWEAHLSQIKMESSDKDIKTTFYTALYHTMIMPTNFTDLNGEYLGFDKEVHTAEGYTYRSDMSLWDTCRNTHSLYTLIESEVQQDCLVSLVEMAKAGGGIPRWPMGAGYSGSMIGDPANIVITESYLKGFTDFDVETAYEYMTYSSDNKTPRSGRDWVNEYNTYGYVPHDLSNGNKSVSRTLEYSWEDGAIADLAAALGKTEDEAKYREKSMYYKNTWNSETKYFQAKNSDGSWYEHFNPKITTFYDAVMINKYAGCYCEGSARQWRYSALQDIDGMIDLFGSKEYFISELEDFMEDAAPTRAFLDPGHGYWIGNQHDIHTPYLFSNAGRKDLTDKWVRWTLKERFSTDINGLDGNDDGGTVSAWYVFSAMGFYPLAGTTNYWIGSPNIDKAEITLANGNTLKITANNQSDKNIYVKSVTLNGVELEGPYVTHEQLMKGGELVFTMSSEA